MSSPARVSGRLFASAGGTLELPSRELVLVGAEDGGHLVVNPPRAVWERSELSGEELAAWSCLVAAAGWAMLAALPQLAGGCVNYWEAGNWALHDEAAPAGPKTPRQHRRVHLHLLGRSPRATNPALRWGEAPAFPLFAQRLSWAASNERLGASACRAIVGLADGRLRERYGFTPRQVAPWLVCGSCGYPKLEAETSTSCAGCPGD